MNPELVDLVDLQQWAERVSARQDLPILLRKLILATTGADLFRAPGGEAVGDPGWDIVIDSPGVPAPWIPDGASRWEGGVSGDIEKKAQSDFTKRTKATPEAEQKTQTFVFFTPRHWPDKDEWIARRKAQANAHWADVQVIDGVDLETWLETQPAAHIWLSERLGHHPTGVEPLPRWWDRWTRETTPPLPSALVTAGRTEQAAALVNALQGPADVHSITSQSRLESIAFVGAALQVSGAQLQIEGVAPAAPEEDEAHEPPPEKAIGGEKTAEVMAEATAADTAAGVEPVAAGTPDTETEDEDDLPVPEGSEFAATDPDGSPGSVSDETPLLSIAMLVHTPEAWARLAVHPGNLVLIRPSRLPTLTSQWQLDTTSYWPWDRVASTAHRALTRPNRCPGSIQTPAGRLSRTVSCT